MGKNFMEASTEAGGYIAKIADIRSKVASLIVEACENRAKSGNTRSMAKDLETMVDGLSEQDKKLVYQEAIILMTKRMGNPSSNRKGRRNDDDDDDDDYPNIFRNRGF